MAAFAREFHIKEVLRDWPGNGIDLRLVKVLLCRERGGSIIYLRLRPDHRNELVLP